MHRKILLLLLATAFTSAWSQDILRSSTGEWEAKISEKGVIQSLKMTFGNDKSVSVPWHSTGEYAGPSFSYTDLYKKKAFTYSSMKTYPLSHSIKYTEENGKLTLLLTVKNNSETTQVIEDETSFRLGINTIMANPKEYFSIFFPTLLRSEKTHFWGYFEAPDGHVLALASSDPIASWHLDYIGNGHRIASACLDLLHPLPLPQRHPQDLFSLAPNETKNWKLVFIPLSNINEVPSAVAKAISIPMIHLERTTASPGETTDIHILSTGGIAPKLIISGPQGQQVPARLVKKTGNDYHYEMVASEQDGMYNIIAQTDRYHTEANIYVRKPWSWYLAQAGKEALRMEQKTARHREAWMGFFSAYWSQVYLPNPAQLNETEEKFEKFWEVMIDPQTGFYDTDKETWHTRPQNTSWMVGVLVARYAATKKIEHLELAAQWADFLIDKFQLPNGAYKGYTALTMGAKFIQELMWFEVPLTKKSAVWKARYKKHQESVAAAAQNILFVKDMGDTEGESTYEDSQAGTAWSLLAMHALTNPKGKDAAQFLKESIAIQKRHECLTQALIPDSRMRGGTLRWWEAQYDVLIMRNMMNSPHAWTMRSQFGAMYLYLLTGKEYYLNVAFNVMASCSQAIDHHTGELRWAFVPDPHVKVKQFVQNYRKSGEGKYVDEVIGEQWVPMISSWWRVPEQEVPWNNERGWSCDNDVHEHFRFMAEQFIPNAFVIERPDGSLRTWNCTIKRQGEKLVITPAEKLVTRVHFNLQKRCQVEIAFADKKEYASLEKGMHWIGRGLSDYRIPSIYLWNEMITKK